MKTQEVPQELRTFYNEFKKLEYRHEYVTVFDDFLSAMMNYFTPPLYPGIDVSCFNKYSQEERLILGKLIPLTIQAFDKQITENTLWYDLFGDFYQLLASRGKQAALGQFFTPAPVVNFMTLIQGDKNELTGKGLRISDPTCGSGRFLIAFHAHFPGNYMYGEDVDLICCKMTCLNLMMHGCEGEVVHHNSLDPNDYRQGWKINSNIRNTGLPSIRPLRKENSYVYRMWQNQLLKAEQQKQMELKKAKEEEIRKVGIQLGLFSGDDDGA